MIAYDLTTSCKELLEAKQREKQAVQERREIEQKITQTIGLAPDFEGTKTITSGAYRVKLTSRMQRKVDAETLQQVAKEHGIFDSLSHLFRWKPEINAAAWKAASSEVTSILSRAVTTTPGRPTITITETMEE